MAKKLTVDRQKRNIFALKQFLKEFLDKNVLNNFLNF